MLAEFLATNHDESLKHCNAKIEKRSVPRHGRVGAEHKSDIEDTHR